MGVKQLWKILNPAGRRVDIATLRGQKLAIDASIWLTQFLKAMRDEDGKMVPNAHLVGAVRRIGKLLYHKIKVANLSAEVFLLTRLAASFGGEKKQPIFCFDGGVPALKRRTLARRRERQAMSKASERRALERHLLSKVLEQQMASVPSPSAAGFRLTSDPSPVSAVAPLAAPAPPALVQADLKPLSPFRPLQPFVPRDAEDLANIGSLPLAERFRVIEELRTRAIEKRHKALLPKSGNPGEYSAFQVQSFLADAKRNYELQVLASEANQQGASATIAAAAAAAVATATTAAEESGQAQEVDDVIFVAPSDEEEQDLQRAMWLSAAEAAAAAAKAGAGEKAGSNGEDEKDSPFRMALRLSMEQAPKASPPRSRRDEFEAELAEALRLSLMQPAPSAASDGASQQASSTAAAAAAVTTATTTTTTTTTFTSMSPSLPPSVPTASSPSLLPPSSQVVKMDEIEWEDDEEARIALVVQHVKPGTIRHVGEDVVELSFRPVADSIALVLFDEKTLERAPLPDDYEDVPELAATFANPLAPPPLPSVDTAATPGGALSAKKEALRPAPIVLEDDEVDDVLDPHRDLVSPYVAPAVISPEMATERALQMASNLVMSTSSALKHRFGLAEPVALLEAPPIESQESMATAASSSLPVSRAEPVSPKIPLVKPLTFDELREEGKEAQRTHARASRDAAVVTPEMQAEVMDLLRLYGLPVIKAPMEAEAQCAWLETHGHVQGVVTEDSDVFLFGARKVYKHIFADKKFVEAYDADEIRRMLGLDRQGLIRLALLLGSDYTSGIKGIGTVNALEVLQAFPGEHGLEEFKQWVQQATLDDMVAAQHVSVGPDGKKITPRKKKSPGKGPLSALEKFKKTHKRSRRSWMVTDDFPSPNVVEAYVSPRVEDVSELNFAPPDREALVTFCKDRLGWNAEQIDEAVLAPLDAYMNRAAGVQTSMERFIVGYGEHKRFAAIKSKRMARAVNALAGRGGGAAASEVGGDDDAEEVLAVDKDGNPVALSEAVEMWKPARKEKKPRENTPTAKKTARRKRTKRSGTLSWSSESDSRGSADDSTGREDAQVSARPKRAAAAAAVARANRRIKRHVVASSSSTLSSSSSASLADCDEEVGLGGGGDDDEEEDDKQGKDDSDVVFIQ